MLQVLPIKESLSNLLELASDGNCSLLFEEINQHLASQQVLKLIPGITRVYKVCVIFTGHWVGYN